MQTVVDGALLLQQVSDYAVQQLLEGMQARLEHLEKTVAAMVAAGAPVVGPGASGAAQREAAEVSEKTQRPARKKVE